ncbi:MAG: redoxin domain-containing protein, partial [Cyanobacteria bacterium HKST-UBA02]|nr:redoxin domain-containing protein [Cyanobacteria bacterium HKST-UBA02]
MLGTGQNFPDFKLPNQDGKEISLAHLSGQWVVVYLYPNADTPGCTIEGKQFSAAREGFDI